MTSLRPRGHYVQDPPPPQLEGKERLVRSPRSTWEHFKYRCEPAGTLIRECGGVRSLAHLLGVSPELVSQWGRPLSKGGYGGRIPDKWWDLVTEAARVRSGYMPDQTMQILRTQSVNSSKQKGDRFERQVVADLVEAGISASKVPLSGAAKGWPGDVIAEHEMSGKWVMQCKITKAEASGGRGAIAKFLNHISFGTVKVGNTIYIAMRRGVFIDMIKGKMPSGVNVPQLILKSGVTIAKHLEGHDALVFRSGGVKEWSALVRRG